MKKLWIIIPLIAWLYLCVCGVVEKLANRDPIIKSVIAEPDQIGIQDTTTLKVAAEDPDDDILAYQWESPTGGQFVSNFGEVVQWIAPDFSGNFVIKIKVTDENGGKATGTVEVRVKGDESPIVTITQPVENEIITGLGIYTVKVNVDFKWSIERVDFFINQDSVYSDRTKPYQWAGWDVTALSGPMTVSARAYEAGDPTNYGTDSVHVTIEGTVPIPK